MNMAVFQWNFIYKNRQLLDLAYGPLFINSCCLCLLLKIRSWTVSTSIIWELVERQNFTSHSKSAGSESDFLDDPQVIHVCIKVWEALLCISSTHWTHPIIQALFQAQNASKIFTTWQDGYYYPILQMRKQKFRYINQEDNRWYWN